MANSPVNAKNPNRKKLGGKLREKSTTIRRTETTAERGNYRTLERGHNATRARDVAITRCNEDIESRRSAEKLADEHKLSNKGE